MAHLHHQHQQLQQQHFPCSTGPSIRESATHLRRIIHNDRPRARGLSGFFWSTKTLDYSDLGVFIGLIGTHGFLQLGLYALSMIDTISGIGEFGHGYGSVTCFKIITGCTEYGYLGCPTAGGGVIFHLSCHHYEYPSIYFSSRKTDSQNSRVGKSS